MAVKSHYETLGVEKGASQEDIKKAYRKKAMENHPDKGGDPEAFKQISLAFSILSDDDKRRKYDMGALDENGNNGGGGGGFDPQSIFEELFKGGGFPGFGMGGGFPGFGQNNHRSKSQKNHHLHKLKISLREAYFGSTKTIKVTINKPCLKCLTKCPECQGQGMVNEMIRMGVFTQVITKPCNRCSGRGKIVTGKSACENCSGSGSKAQDHQLTVNIPVGVSEGHRIKFDGLGEQPNNDEEIAGDLIFEITIAEDPVFKRNDADLLYEVKLSFTQSIIGKEIIVPAYSEPIHINTGMFGIINPNKKYKIEGKGMIQGHRTGDIILTFIINYPTKVLGHTDTLLISKLFSELGI